MDNMQISAQGAKVGLEALLADLEGETTASPVLTQDGEDTQSSGECQTVFNDLLIGLVDAETVPTKEASAINTGLAAIADKKAQRAARDAADKVIREAIALKRKKERVVAAAAKKVERETAAAQKVADKEAKKVADAAQKEVDAAAKAALPASTEPETPKAAAEPRIFWGRNKLGRLEHRLGQDVSNVMLFDIKDGELNDEDRLALIAGNKDYFKTLPVKVQDQATSILEYVSGKAYRMNPSVDVTVNLLGKDRFLTAGDEGNLYLRLREFYSIGSARSMAGATILALKALEIVKMSAAKTFTPNPESSLLALLSGRMLLSFVNQDEALEALEAAETAASDARVAAKTAPVVEAPPAPVTKEVPVRDISPLIAAEIDNGIMADLLTGLAGVTTPGEPALDDAEAAAELAFETAAS